MLLLASFSAGTVFAFPFLTGRFDALIEIVVGLILVLLEFAGIEFLFIVVVQVGHFVVNRPVDAELEVALRIIPEGPELIALIRDLLAGQGRKDLTAGGGFGFVDQLEPVGGEEGDAAQGEGLEEVASVGTHGRDTLPKIRRPST